MKALADAAQCVTRASEYRKGLEQPLTISIGFEMEATTMSVYVEGLRAQRLSKHVLTDSISIYGTGSLDPLSVLAPDSASNIS